MKRIMNKYLLLFFCIFSLVLPTGCEIKEQKQVVVDYQEYYFRNEDLLESHYEKHGKEMGFSSSKEYEMSASDVVNNPESLHKTEKEDGDDVYYKENTNEFVVVSTDGYIRTYFNPDSGKKYFDRQ
jgi:pyocin large subunit-like protein